MNEPPPRMTAVYVHIPYCKSKCPYCDFASAPRDKSVSKYLYCLALEIAGRRSEISHIDTVYVGGGTPTILSADTIEWLLDLLHEQLPVSRKAEVTVEANPGTLTRKKVEALVASGVNRVSLGAQSFVEAELSFLGRAHTVPDIGKSVSLLRAGGIRNISLDLMYGIPNQDMHTWHQSLECALELGPEHISTYCLTYEPGTEFGTLLKQGALKKKSDDEELELYELAHETLVAAGYEHYEISNFALPGRRSRHNMVYWRNEEYMGLGAGAVSYLDGERVTNHRGISEYIRSMEEESTAEADVEEISSEMQAVETMIQGLRLREGVNMAAFESRFANNLSLFFKPQVDELVSLGLLELTPTSVRCTLRGWCLANEIAMRLLP
ncbi:MAG: radical SAM family heme chaperone HemW [Candidatus Abyssubacteria bacterium]